MTNRSFLGREILENLDSWKSEKLFRI